MNKDSKIKILVTGATGFVGKVLCSEIGKKDVEVVATIRSNEQKKLLPSNVKTILIDSIDDNTNWEEVISGVDVVVHLAARVHVKNEKAADPLTEFRLVNALGTERLALAAASAGAKKFIFMSTIGVNGNSSGEEPFTENSKATPHNMYSISKYEAEEKLLEIGRCSNMQVVCLRAPLLYGPCDPGNFLTLVKIIELGIPLPITGIKNLKSFLYVENLTDAIWRCIELENARGIYLISDDEDVSTFSLVKKIALELNVQIKLFYLPLFISRFFAFCVGKKSSFEQLISTLTIDCTKIKKELNWEPPYDMNTGLKKTIRWYQDREKY